MVPTGFSALPPPGPAMPDVAANVVVERRRGSLEVSFLPFVVRGGKYM